MIMQYPKTEFHVFGPLHILTFNGGEWSKYQANGPIEPVYVGTENKIASAICIIQILKLKNSLENYMIYRNERKKLILFIFLLK